MRLVAELLGGVILCGALAVGLTYGLKTIGVRYKEQKKDNEVIGED